MMPRELASFVFEFFTARARVLVLKRAGLHGLTGGNSRLRMSALHGNGSLRVPGDLSKELLHSRRRRVGWRCF